MKSISRQVKFTQCRIVCGIAQSKLNGGTHCKTCFNKVNKGVIKSKELTNNVSQVSHNTHGSINNDVSVEVSNDADIINAEDINMESSVDANLVEIIETRSCRYIEFISNCYYSYQREIRKDGNKSREEI